MPDNDFFPKKRATLRDIARQANVSASTVSRVLNNYPHVDEYTRTIVRQAAQELDYALENLRSAPNVSSSVALLSRQTKADQIGSLAGIEYLAARGIQAVMEADGIMTYVRRVQMTRREVDELVEDPALDGLIILGGMIEHDFVRWLQASPIPFVMAGSHVLPLQTNCVMADIRSGVEQAVEHLIERGRRRIGLVNGSQITNTSVEKLKALRLSLHLHDLPYVPEQTVFSDFNAEAGHRDTLRLLEQFPDVDAILYGDDNMAMGGLRALKETGRRVPDDVAIVGFHGYEVVQYTDPPLTSVEFDMEMLGRMAAHRLCLMLRERDGEHWQMLVPTRLVVRGTT